MTTIDTRYLRQQHAMPEERRITSALFELGGEYGPRTSTALKTGAAVMGVPLIASDHHGPADLNCHWYLGDHHRLVRTLNHDDAQYLWLDPLCPEQDLPALRLGHDNAWLVVHLGDVAAAKTALSRLAPTGTCPVLLTLCGPGGVMVLREADAAAARRRLDGVTDRRVSEGPAELGLIVAGACLNEVIFAGAHPRDDLARSTLAAFYSLHRPRRVDVRDEEPLDELIAELARPPQGPAVTFRRRQLIQVGGGALGNYTALALALDGGAHLQLIDGDPHIERHNLNRQALLIDGVGRPKAPVLAEALRQIDPSGRYEARTHFVHSAQDLGSLAGVEAVVAAPDNNACRAVCGAATWQAGVPLAQGATGATGGQATVHEPGRACLECVCGLRRASLDRAGPVSGPAQSCWRVEADSVVSSNLVTAGLMVSELRQCLAGRRSMNVRFVGRGGLGNRLGRTPSDPPCPHRAGAMAGGQP